MQKSDGTGSLALLGGEGLGRESGLLRDCEIFAKFRCQLGCSGPEHERRDSGRGNLADESRPT